MDSQSKPTAKEDDRKAAGYKRLLGCVGLIMLGCIFLISGLWIYNQTLPCNGMDVLLKLSGCQGRTKIFSSSIFRLSKKGDLIVSLVYDRKKELDILDLNTNVLKQIRRDDGLFGGHGDGDLTDDLALSNDGNYAAIVSSGYLGLVQLKVEQPQPVWLDLAENEYATRGAFSPDDKTMAAAIHSDSDYLAFYSTAGGKRIAELKGDGDNHAVAYSPNGEAVTSFGGKIQFWDPNTQTVEREFGSDLSVHSILFSPDGVLLAATTGQNYSSKMAIDVFRVDDGEQLYHLSFDPRESFDEDVKISFSPNSQILAASSCSEIVLYQLSDGELVRDFSPYRENFGLSIPCLGDVQFASDGKSVYYAWAKEYSNATINKMALP